MNEKSKTILFYFKHLKKKDDKKECYSNKSNHYIQYIQYIHYIIRIQKLFRKRINNKSIYNDYLTKEEIMKIDNGINARAVWSKKIKKENCKITIQDFNKKCGNVFYEIATIKLDLSTHRQTTLYPEIKDEASWNVKKEFIYIITFNDYIIKIGGTGDGMKGRWSSYISGHCVSQRKNKKGKNYLGKMSVTNAYLYHTIENSLIINKNNIWKIYAWNLPISKFTMNILGQDTVIIAQTFHAYETICINKYKDITGTLPFLCDNCDPHYK